MIGRWRDLPAPLRAELDAVTRRAFVPRLFVELYAMSGLMAEEAATGWLDPDLAVWRVLRIMDGFPGW